MRFGKRDDIPEILNGRGLVGAGAEIGVLRGEFSMLLLSKWKGSKLYSIDSWKHYEEGYFDSNNSPDDIQEQSYATATANLAPFGKRSEILRMSSKEASGFFEDERLDFVFIDANHSYEACLEDIRLWFPKVKTNGVIAGHDYTNAVRSYATFGVKRAVKEFFHDREVFLSTEEPWPTWLVVK